ncbi:DUF5994 family protein [Streptomyces wuyuanensis]|uniref:DUF5994 family protein n=1 Tax=Streptomyces wuyuanensis TaxID=1196353 RepID=UPI00384E4C17
MGPRARNDETELPTPISASADHLGPVTRAGVHTSASNRLPTRLVVDHRVVHLGPTRLDDETPSSPRRRRPLRPADASPSPCWRFPRTPPPMPAAKQMARAVPADSTTAACRIAEQTMPQRLDPRSSTVDAPSAAPLTDSTLQTPHTRMRTPTAGAPARGRIPARTSVLRSDRGTRDAAR